MKELALLALFGACGYALGQGTLVPPDEFRHRPIPWGTWAITSHKVDVVIKDGVADTRVEQVFQNLGNTPLEAVYLFPVPKDAAISQLSLIVDDKKLDAKILPAEQARQIYRQIVSQLRDPALLEVAGSRLVRISLFPIPPRGQSKVVLSYSETLPRDGGAYRYTYPFRLDERSSQKPSKVLLTARILSSQPIQTVYSPTHPETGVRALGPKEAAVSWEAAREYVPRDFQLLIKSGGDAIGMSALGYRSGGDGYFLLFLSPRLYGQGPEMPKSIVFVFDRTGSMDGAKIKQAKEALRFCLQHLRKTDRFELITFNDGVDKLFRGTVPSTDENVRSALRAVDEIDARGGTNIQDALYAGLESFGKEDRGFRAVVFLTDGLPTVGETSAERIQDNVKDRNRGEARVFTFGVGNDVDSHLLDTVAADSGGDSSYVIEGEPIGSIVEGFFEKVAVPALSNIKLEFEGLNEYDVFPKQMRDLFRGSAIVLAGRCKGDKGRVTISGDGPAGKEKSFLLVDFTGNQDRDDYVSRVWAARKIGWLLDQAQAHGSKELIDEIMRLSVEYGIPTPYTSMLITEDGKVPPMWRLRRGAGETINPGDLPLASYDPADNSIAYGQAAPGSASAGDIEGFKKAGGGGLGGRAQSGKEKAADSRASRQAGDKVFYRVNGVWTDALIRPGSKFVKVKAFSDAHLALVEKVKRLGEYCKAGLPVMIQLPGGVVQIGEEGEETLSPARISALVGK